METQPLKSNNQILNLTDFNLIYVNCGFVLLQNIFTQSLEMRRSCHCANVSDMQGCKKTLKKVGVID